MKQIESANKEFDALPEWMKHPNDRMPEASRFDSGRETKADDRLSPRASNRRKTTA
jgi:hypothetical protein